MSLSDHLKVVKKPEEGESQTNIVVPSKHSRFGLFHYVTYNLGDPNIIENPDAQRRRLRSELEDAVTSLNNRINRADDAIFYSGLSAGFVIAILSGVQAMFNKLFAPEVGDDKSFENIEKLEDQNIIFDTVTAFIALSATFVASGVSRHMRNKAISMREVALQGIAKLDELEKEMQASGGRRRHRSRSRH